MFFVNGKYLSLALLCVASGVSAQPAAKPPTMPQAPVEIITETAPPPAPVSAARTTTMNAGNAAEIQRINENMTVKSARLGELNLEAQIATKQKEINALKATTGAGAGAFDSARGTPSVVSVAGLKGALEAVLVFPGGAVQRVKAGDVIADRKVVSVGINEVLLADLKGRNVQRLGFGSSAMSRDLNPGQAGGMPTTNSPVPGTMFPSAAR